MGRPTDSNPDDEGASSGGRSAPPEEAPAALQGNGIAAAAAAAGAASQTKAATEHEIDLLIKQKQLVRANTEQVDERELLRLVQEEAMQLPDLGLALTGLAGRFPKSDSMNEFEANLREGRDMINDQDEARFACGLWGLPPRAGRLRDLSRFDHEFFGFKLDEANYIDFQLRILYEVVYESIVDAGVNPASLRGSRTGVFFGLHCNEFENAMADDPAFKSGGYYAQFAVKVAQYFDFRGLTVTFDAACASGFVGFHNAVDALRQGLIEQAIVCSSNIPIHPTGSFIFLQMQMLSPTGYSRFLDSRADGYVKSESCVSLLVQRKQVARRNYASIMATMTSVDGYKKEGITFPSDRSQERLIRSAKLLAGISTNHVEYLEAHGTGTPAGDPQEARAISNVYYKLDETTTGGNGSGDRNDHDHDADGDDQNSASVGERRRIGPLLVGSVKTNMGHSEAASGLCALAKVALMFEHEVIYKSLHYEQPNTNIESLVDGRLKFVDETRPLRAKIVPLSCYGFGGSNVHAIVRASERPRVGPASASSLLTSTGGGDGGDDEHDENQERQPRPRPDPRLVVMFGRSEAALDELFDRLLDRGAPETRHCLTDDFLALLNELSNVDQIDRLMTHRGYLLLDPVGGVQLARDIKPIELKPAQGAQAAQEAGNQAAATSARPARGQVDLGRSRHHPQDAIPRPCHLILPGVGSQWAGMAAGLRHFAPFWATIERLSALLAPYEWELNLVEALSSPDEKLFDSAQMCTTFVAVVAYQVALINLLRQELRLRHVGAIVGHSLGEISAAYAAGLFDEREAIMVAYQLGRALDESQHLVAGRMVALEMGEFEALELLEQFNEGQAKTGQAPATICVCCVNGPQSVTVSGAPAEMRAFCAHLRRVEIHFRCINDSFALHNKHIMDRPELRAKLREALERVLLPLTDYDRIGSGGGWLSCFGKDLVDKRALEQANADYFIEMLCNRVDFLAALEELDGQVDPIALEVGPSNLFEAQLTLMETPGPNKRRKFHYVRTMRRLTPSDAQVRQLLTSLGQLYQAGATFDLNRLYHGPRGFPFPVRRGTPSVSSLLKWRHEQQLFVPRYPSQFSKSSAKSEMPVDIVQDRDKYLADHCIEGRILYPATAYLFLMWRVFSFSKRKIYDACFHDVERELVPIEFRNVRLLRAVLLGNRTSQIYVHFEEATGRFEIKEGGSVAVEGWAFTPSEAPQGLLYDQVRRQISNESLELSMTKDDVYKQFRVSGYDYGETFRNIEACSPDGRHCRIRFNGHFIALTDSVLQSIFLAVNQYAPSGGLFLPTRFDYVRFQPELILAKVRAARMALDKTEGALNTMAKREIMTKMMQRASGGPTGAAANESSAATDAPPAAGAGAAAEQPLECIFETFCDPVTGIIITDGIEMRGVRATPAPRRPDTNEVLLESYQFVPDLEEPVDDERLTSFETTLKSYARACDSMALELLERLCQRPEAALGALIGQGQLAGRELEAYKKLHLECIAGARGGASDLEGHDEADASEALPPRAEKVKDSAADGHEADYDIRKNAPRNLMSVLDQLLAKPAAGAELAPNQIRQLVQANRLHLMRDLIQTPWTSERFMRPLVETVIENCCTKRAKLRLLEINLDDELLSGPLQQMIQLIEPTLALDYSVAHPEPNRLGSGKTQPAVKTHTLRDLASLFNDSQLRELDLIVYKDISCYSLPRQTVEQNGLAPVLSSLDGAVRRNGFVVLVMRNRLTLAERVLLALSEPQLVGLSGRDLELIRCAGDDQSRNKPAAALAGALAKIEQINSMLAAREKLMLEEAARNQMLCVARKSDANGCLVVLLKRTSAAAKSGPAGAEAKGASRAPVGEAGAGAAGRLILRVRHDQLDWLDELKRNFQQEPAKREQQTEANTTDEQQQQQQKQPQDAEQQTLANQDERREPRQVWLCAAATKQNPINGLVGMMQALRKELGSHHLRCFYDLHTFRNSDEPVHASDIERSGKFKLALERDLIWNCVDSLGRLGAYRHFTINEFMSPESSLCNSKENNRLLQAERELRQQRQPEVDSSGCDQARNTAPLDASGSSHLANLSRRDDRTPSGAFVNVATRGDLSSFTWFEAPYKYLDECERAQLVRVAYAALNFRDIMLASGRLPLDSIPARLVMSDCLLGLEFSGHDWRGRRVMGITFGRGIATHVLCPENAAIKVEVPDSLSLSEAATIPIVYSTAILALVYRARMQRGESVLIHAGSGGVGQAAIRLAGHWGLRVFTTVGSAEKRRLLLEEFGDHLSDEQIFNSRDCSFEAQVMSATRGQGVDIVLNSLADDKLQASLRCLREGGRFLEIGKYDLSMDSRLELLQLNTNKTFHGILLDKLFDHDGATDVFQEQMDAVLATLKRGLAEGFVRPIRHKLFKRNQVEQAFRHMATGKHTGKVLIEIEPELERPRHGTTGGGQRQLAASRWPAAAAASASASVPPAPQAVNLRCVARFQLSPDSSYIVTGGLGGFGLELCKWLANRGARWLVITSRSGPRTGYQRATLERLERNNATRCLVVSEAEADASTPEGARKLCQLAAEWAPARRLAGLFHLAMVLKDTLLENMSADDFRLVCRPKVEACVQLDAATSGQQQQQQHRLDYFVAFSSITCGKGNAGQANYAYANSCLERVCEQRRARGQHGLAIQWGAIGDVGVAFENLGGNNVIVGGTIPQRMPSCLATLDKLLCSPFAVCLSVLPVGRSGDQARERGNLVDAIMHVLGIKDTSKVSEDSTLGDLGLDSLMAVEIRQYIEREYDLTLNIQEIRALTIARIREINDSEKPKKQLAAERAAAAKGTAAAREVSSYGAQPAPAEAPVVTSAPPASQLDSNGGAVAAPLQPVAANATDALQGQQAGPGKPESATKGQSASGPASQVRGELTEAQVRRARQAALDEAKLGALFERGAVSTFVPPLALPRDDFCRLNQPPVDANGNQQSPPNGRQASARPLFFLPPIHGGFEQLEAACAHVNRPCVGLNWTRKLGRARTLAEAVRVYLDLLQRAHWRRDFGCTAAAAAVANGNGATCLQSQPANDADDDDDGQLREQVVDLVGYSYGATIAFELMLAIHGLQRARLAASAAGKTPPCSRNQLVPGHLVLLDGSPKQVELGSRLVTSFTRRKPLKLSERIDELLMVYVVAHGRRSAAHLAAADYLQLQQQLAAVEVEEKAKLASAVLARALDGNANEQQQQQQQQRRAAAVGADCLAPTSNGNGLGANSVNNGRGSLTVAQNGAPIRGGRARPSAARQTEIAYAMEAFYRRYELVMNYKATGRLQSECTLIRAEQMYLQREKPDEPFNEDLELSSVVEGKLNLHVMRGDHESFLSINSKSIGDILSNLGAARK